MSQPPPPRAFAEKLGGAPHSKASLRLWLRLLSCSMIIERRIRGRFEAEFATTLPRFDVMAALEREPDGLTMSQLSAALLVSNGNVTGIVNRLIEELLVVRTLESDDRRVATVRLTRKGRDVFQRMARGHEKWIDKMFAGLTEQQMEQLMKLLASVRHSIDEHEDEQPA
ncbi:MarR family winged helix-turn-helix transcriptional regulator [Steroidobacter sp.]|uniref:MarR family winged helix-turn-helix transcriptional regulator n=1 Tax=Steroidobacter sp. TaxID=1978227 RepID=UPI001A5F2E42|nr:MarR family transcriptional regulator [Steroidobacter sp.]MBL8265221.1 MarR family transcriptional regulator [Steroidobacter sp.]